MTHAPSMLTSEAAFEADLARVATLRLDAERAYLRLCRAIDDDTLTPDDRRRAVLVCGAWERADDGACTALEAVENGAGRAAE